MGTETEISNFFMEPVKVSLIEQNRLVRKALAKRLSLYNHIEVVDVRPYLPDNPEELTKLSPDAILLGLPQHSVSNSKMIFSQVYDWTRSNISVVALSPYIDTDDRRNFLAAGGVDYLLKTINSDQIVQVLTQITQSV